MLYSSTQASTSIILLVASISLIFALTRPPRALLPRGSRRRPFCYGQPLLSGAANRISAAPCCFDQVTAAAALNLLDIAVRTTDAQPWLREKHVAY